MTDKSLGVDDIFYKIKPELEDSFSGMKVTEDKGFDLVEVVMLMAELE